MSEKRLFQMVDMDGNPVEIDLAAVLAKINANITIGPLMNHGAEVVHQADCEYDAAVNDQMLYFNAAYGL